MDTKPTVLVVDDMPINLDLVEDILKNDYDLLLTTSAHDAIRLAEEEDPHLILLDIMMPEISGFEAAKIIKNNQSTTGIPIIFLTNKTEIESIIQGFEIGASDYITKPFLSCELLVRVKAHVQQRKRFLIMDRLLHAQAKDLRKTNVELNLSLKKLNEPNVDKYKLIESVSHQLRTPLTSILGYAEALVDFSEGDDLKELADIVLQESANLSIIVDNIVDVIESDLK